MKHLILLSVTALAVTGCNSGGDAGDVDTAAAAARSAPKSAADLPKDMPAEARRSAEAAMGSPGRAAAEDPARVRAMQEMNKQRGGG